MNREEMKKEIKKLTKLVRTYRKTLRIPLCEICGKTVDSNKDRVIIKMCERSPSYREYVVQHLHIVCWNKILKEFKYHVKEGAKGA